MRRRFAATGPQDGAIFAEMNTTPLIDVMLVLLVMMILCLPAMLHKVPVPLPQPGPAPESERITHRLEIGAGGGVMLDGRAVAPAALAARLGVLRADPRTELTIRTDPTARYDAFAQVMATVRRSGIERVGFVGHEGMV